MAATGLFLLRAAYYMRWRRMRASFTTAILPFPLHCDELRKLKGRWLARGEKKKKLLNRNTYPVLPGRNWHLILQTHGYLKAVSE